MSDNEPYEPQHAASEPEKAGFLSNAWYDRLKFLAVIVLPALGTLYFALAGIWGLPKAEEVVGTIVALDAFLGVVLQISSSQYSNDDSRFDGRLNLEPDPENPGLTNMGVSIDPEAVFGKDEVTLKVNKDS